MLREKPKVVCDECRWTFDVGLSPPVPSEEWECDSPLTTESQGWDPVTGEEIIPHPLCRVVNHNGKCKYHEPRDSC